MLQSLHNARAALCGALLSTNLLVAESVAQADEMVQLPTGAYKPLFKPPNGVESIPVPTFALDRYPVTNAEFRSFTDAYPRWRRGAAPPVLVDENYLVQFVAGNAEEIGGQPVTHVSWFAARAYCKARGKRLPSTAEWEYAAQASADAPDGSSDPAFKRIILDWYARPATGPLPEVRDTPANYWGVHGLHGVVWELVNDFNTALVTGESRGDSQLEKSLFCGAGAANSVDPGDYAAFMRYALRSSYQARYTLASLGFRCASDIATPTGAVDPESVDENS